MLRVLMACLLLFVQTVSAVTLDDVRQRLSADAVLRAHFVQQRTVKGLSRPLRSSGELLVARHLAVDESKTPAQVPVNAVENKMQAGIWWHQQTPFSYELTLTSQWFRQQLPNAKAEIITADQQPMMFEFFGVMLGLMQADFSALSERFEVDFSSQGEQWHVVLTPRSTMISRVFLRIDLHGQRFLEQVKLTEPSGNLTQLTFSEQQTIPAVLTQKEQQYFAN
jgi:hypothetical protein